MKKKEKNIKFSKKAYKDGLDFSKLPIEEQALTNVLYKDSSTIANIRYMCLHHDDADVNDEVEYINRSGKFVGMVYSFEKLFCSNKTEYRLRVILPSGNLAFVNINYELTSGVYSFIKREYGGYDEASKNLPGNWIKFTVEPYLYKKFRVNHMSLVDNLTAENYKNMVKVYLSGYLTSLKEKQCE